jgi:predicted HAD superfamily Cof-like phosphohydrolase
MSDLQIERLEEEGYTAYVTGRAEAEEKAEFTNFRKVQEFHDVFTGGQRPARPEIVDDVTFVLRLDLIQEELDELVVAHYNGDLVEVADAIGDLLYVVYGTADVMGIPIDKVFEEIHRSNMTKLTADGRVVLREDGKVLKGDRYEEPKLSKILGM